MNVQTQIDKTSPRATEHFDVLIAGAGISGVGAAYHLTKQLPGTTFVALETQKTFGGEGAFLLFAKGHGDLLFIQARVHFSSRGL